MAFWTGWVAVLCIVCAALLPLGQRLLGRKRAALAHATVRAHVALGFGTSLFAFVHVLGVLPALGSPAAIAGGMGAIAPAVAAFFLLVAHTGVGLQLRNPKLRERVSKRRVHLLTASSIALAVGLHVFGLRAAG